MSASASCSRTRSPRSPTRRSKPDPLLAKGRAALALKTSAPARRALSLLLAQRLSAAGRTDDAVAVLGPPPHGDDEVGRYIAFKQMEAHARAGRLAAAARGGARGARRGARTPTSRTIRRRSAIMDIALRTLLASPVSDETLEVLESLGPPRERLGRADAFAQAALEAGAFRSAMATFLWLYENDNDPNRQLQNLARASVAAARAGDRAEFARTFRLLAGQEDRLEGDDDKKTASQRTTRRPTGRATARTGPPRPTRSTRPARSSAPTGIGTRPDRGPKLELQARDGALIASAESEKVREKRRAARSVNWQRALLVVARDALPGAGRERRPAQPGHAGRHVEAPPGATAAAVPSTKS